MDLQTALALDLDATTETLRATFGWEPTARRASEQDGAEFAAYQGSVPGSACLELLAAAGPGVVAEHLDRHGPGAYRLTIAVHGLGPAARGLDDRGIRYDAVAAVGDDGARLRLDPDSVGGVLLDLVEA